MEMRSDNWEFHAAEIPNCGSSTFTELYIEVTNTFCGEKNPISILVEAIFIIKVLVFVLELEYDIKESQLGGDKPMIALRIHPC